MKIYVLDPFYPDGVEYAAQRAEVIRWDDPRAGNWHEDADGVMVRVKRIGAEDIARAPRRAHPAVMLSRGQDHRHRFRIVPRHND
jgi:hypothetical protein